MKKILIMVFTVSHIVYTFLGDILYYRFIIQQINDEQNKVLVDIINKYNIIV